MNQSDYGHSRRVEGSNFFRNVLLTGILLLMVVQTGLSITMEVRYQKVAEAVEKMLDGAKSTWGK